MPAANANLGSSRYFNGICRLADFATLNSSAHCGLRRHAQCPARWCRGGGQVRDSLRQGVDASATPRAVSWARAKPASIRARAQTLAGGETKTLRPVVTLSPALPRWASRIARRCGRNSCHQGDRWTGRTVMSREPPRNTSASLSSTDAGGIGHFAVGSMLRNGDTRW
jgi:hypothetical protein